jgi:small subunit ribosomal protein S8
MPVGITTAARFVVVPAVLFVYSGSAVSVSASLPTKACFQELRKAAGNMSSPLIDTLIRLKNSYMARQSELTMPSSVLRLKLLGMLKHHGFVAAYEPVVDTRNVRVKLNSSTGTTISDVRLFSTPGRHLYSKTGSLPWGKYPHSLIIISTSQGLMSAKQAVAKKIGGELIAEVI